MLLGTHSGINLVDLSLVLPQFSVLNPSDKEFKLNAVEDIVKQNDSTFWIGTSGEGLFKLSLADNGFNFSNFQANDINRYSIPNNIVNQVLLDKTGSIWAVTQDGLGFFDPEKQGFQSYAYEYGNPKSVMDKTVWSLFKKDSVVWAGTRQGITAIDRKNNKYYQYPFKSSNLNQPNNNSIYHIIQGPFGKLWTCTSSGLFILNVDPFNKNKFSYQKLIFEIKLTHGMTITVII